MQFLQDKEYYTDRFGTKDYAFMLVPCTLLIHATSWLICQQPKENTCKCGANFGENQTWEAETRIAPHEYWSIPPGSRHPQVLKYSNSTGLSRQLKVSPFYMILVGWPSDGSMSRPPWDFPEIKFCLQKIFVGDASCLIIWPSIKLASHRIIWLMCCSLISYTRPIKRVKFAFFCSQSSIVDVKKNIS